MIKSESTNNDKKLKPSPFSSESTPQKPSLKTNEEKKQDFSSKPTEKQTRIYMYVKYPELSGAACIIKLLKDRNIEIYSSYDIKDLNVQGPFDIMIVPGGTAKVQEKDLGPEGIEIIKEFVSKGGGYVGFCAGGYLAALPPIEKKNKPGMGLIKCRYILPKKMMQLNGTVQVQMNLLTYKQLVEIPYHNGPSFDISTSEGEKIEILGYNTKLIGFKWEPMKCKPCMLRCVYGEGYVVVIGPHPEANLPDLAFQLIMAAKRDP